MIEQVPSTATKVFVLDTNVILHDAGCLRNFEDNDIAVPITVLEELAHVTLEKGERSELAELASNLL